MPSNQLGEALGPLVERVVASYFDDPRTHHIDREFLPSKRGIKDICDLLMELTYPGYIGRHGLTRHNISYHVGELLPRLWEQLAEQVTRCLCHLREAGEHNLSDAACRQRADALASRFVERIPDVRRLLADDVQAAYDGDPAATSTAEIILAYPALLAVTIYRYAHELHEMGVAFIPRIMTEHAHYLTGIDIHPGARIGRSFFIDHGTGVVIGETTQIGDNVKIYQGVTLGALSFPKDERGRIIRGSKRHPTIGNNVTIYANAIVLGGETVIGDGAVVGGSVFITEGVEPGHQVSITPPVLRVRPPKGATPRIDGRYVPDWVI
jgi:serine O-acetyltransferase